ncbi:MAG: hypothetical protein RLZZ385_1593 [Pseudomonadota bacterium]
MSQLDFIFGLGLFLLGMTQLEQGIHALSDARLRHWLRHSTGTTLSSVGTGVVTTAILQSSSMVSLLVLAFASAGVLPLINAIGIILGANLGTTVTGWIVATVGFKLDLEALALPVLGAASFMLVLIRKDRGLYHLAVVALGIGLLLFGLGLMKDSMEQVIVNWDVAVLQGHHAVVYLLAGVVVAALIRSSSAVMMMALAALDAQLITLAEAAALAIGADLGTTSTTVLGSLTGNVVKRKLAFAHCFFNIVVDLAAFVLLLPVLAQLLELLRIQDPLYGLVAFHSVMNLLGLLVFVPLLGWYTSWIEKVFARRVLRPRSLLERVAPDVVDAALVALRDTVGLIVLQAVCNAMRMFGLRPERLKSVGAVREELLEDVTHMEFNQGYEDLKKKEGEILRYSLKIQAQPMGEAQALELERLLAVTRAVIYSNKTLKDIQGDLQELRHGELDTMRDLFERHKQYHKVVYQQLIELLLGDHPMDYVMEELNRLLEQNDRYQQESDRLVYANAGADAGDGTVVSIQFNVNREIRHSVKHMVRTLRVFLQKDSATDSVAAVGELPAEG